MADLSMQQRIEQKLNDHFAPQYLQVVNQSHKHQGHQGDDGSGESHFDVKIVSREFKGMSRIDRQRKVFEVLADEMKIVHALALQVSDIK